jgi:hypothetical protein
LGKYGRAWVVTHFGDGAKLVPASLFHVAFGARAKNQIEIQQLERHFSMTCRDLPCNL